MNSPQEFLTFLVSRALRSFKLYLSIALCGVIGILAQPTRGDSIATLELSASMITSVNPGYADFDAGPSLFVTGQFTFDQDTGSILSWSLSFLGPAGATYRLSAQDGGVANARCFGGLPPCTGEDVDWLFSFGNGTASFAADLLRGNLPGPFFPGETLQLCEVPTTFYPGNIVAFSAACDVTSGGFFDGQTGVVYSVPLEPCENETTVFCTVFSSGVITVASTPEPAESILLLVSLACIFATRLFQRKVDAAALRALRFGSKCEYAQLQEAPNRAPARHPPFRTADA